MVEGMKAMFFPPRSWVFDPGLLLGDQALQELRSLFLVGLNTFAQEHLANLRQSPLIIVRHALELALEFRSHPKS